MAAIYDWSHTEFGVIEVTTTLYPMETLDKIQFSADVAEMGMYPIPNDSAEVTFGFGDGSYKQKRWFHTVEVDPTSSEISFAFGDGTYTQKRWFYTEDFDADNAEISFGFGNGTYKPKRVFGFAPPEKVQFTVNISPEDCSMSDL